MKINKRAFQLATGASDANTDAWIDAFQAAFDEFGVQSDSVGYAILAHVGVESGQLTTFQENLNYSAQGLANTWANRYSSTGRAGGAPNELAKSLDRNPQAIANNVYANRMGNGDVESGDGWKHRGMGPIQLTGKDTQFAFMMDCDVDMVHSPMLITLQKDGSRSAVWFCLKYKAGFVSAIEAGKFGLTTKIVNGADPCEANHGPLRESRFAAAVNAAKQP